MARRCGLSPPDSANSARTRAPDSRFDLCTGAARRAQAADARREAASGDRADVAAFKFAQHARARKSLAGKLDKWRAQRKAQELAYLEHALAINASTSMEPAKQARERAKAEFEAELAKKEKEGLTAPGQGVLLPWEKHQKKKLSLTTHKTKEI